jgi:putative ABC transport system ATP-binding protein
MALLEVLNATKFYGEANSPVMALQDVSLTVGAGEYVALIGRSGCGKSTLLNLCGAMDFPTSGEIHIDGQVTTRLNDAELTRLRRDKVGFIFQSFQLLHTLTVIENVELPLLLARKPAARSAALERLRWIEMEHYASRLPHQLSGGQQQRVAIARALVHDPKLILADEPTGNLDTATGEIVIKLLRRIASELGAAVVMATHSSESASSTDQVIHLRDGRLVGATVPQ